MDQIIFEIEGKPFGKQRPKFARRGNRTITYTPEKTVKYEEAVRREYRIAAHIVRPDFWNKPIKLNAIAYMQIPKSFSKQKANDARAGILLPTTKPDTDNIGKIIKDALNGEAYKDDAQVVDLHVIKYYADKPKVVVTLAALGV